MNNDFEFFKQIIRESNYDNTYKMAWAKALVELSSELDLNCNIIEIKFDSISSKIIKYYWNQTIFFNMQQGSNPIKIPVVISYIKDLIRSYYELSSKTIPEIFERAENKFEKIGLTNYYKKTIVKISNALKQDVCWRFLYLNGKSTDIYECNKDNKIILVNSNLLKLIKENQRDLNDLINYRWGLILETFNSSPQINKKVKIMDEREIKRSSLYKYKDYLLLENPKCTCFICEKKIEENNISIDHVIPWSYMYSDDIWNLVFVCKKCNSIKNNTIPNENIIKKLKERNQVLLDEMVRHNLKNKIYDELKVSIEKDYVNKFWIGSKG